MSHKFITREKSLLFFDREGEFNPSSSLQIWQLGNIGITHSFMGIGAYERLVDSDWKLWFAEGIEELLAVVSDPHLRLMKYRLRNGAVVTIEGQCVINGRTLHRISIKPRVIAAAQLELFEETTDGKV